MKRINLIFAASILGATPVLAEETVVTLSSSGQDMVGTLAIPEGDPAPVVLLLHGFTGSRDELKTEHVPEGVFAHTANALLAAGYASLRIDFRGSGESLADLSFADTTFDSQIADAEAAVSYLQSLNTVAGDDIHVVGWSQGGLVAASLAGQVEGLDSVSLWNAVGDPEATYGSLIDTETMAKGKAAAPDDVIAVTLPWGAELELKGAFFDGVETHDPVGDISVYSGPLFVAQGQADTTVLPENADRFLAAHEGVEELWLEDMDHVFNIFGTNETLDELIGATLAFIEAQAD